MVTSFDCGAAFAFEALPSRLTFHFPEHQTVRRDIELRSKLLRWQTTVLPTLDALTHFARVTVAISIAPKVGALSLGAVGTLVMDVPGRTRTFGVAEGPIHT